MSTENIFLKNIENLIIISKTSLTGNIIYANDLFCQISEYSREELIDKPHNIVRHPDMSKEIFKVMWETIKKGETWSGKVMNRTKSNKFYITYTIVAPVFDEQNKIIEYISLRFLITEEEEKNKQFKKNITKLLSEYKMKIATYEKNVNNNELKKALENNYNLTNEIKELNNTFEMRLNAKSRSLLSEISILRNNDHKYQKTVDSLREENDSLLKEIEQLKEEIDKRNNIIENKEIELIEEKKISKGRLDLINELEKTKSYFK